MIKCPNCGSTAQVKLMFADDLDEKDSANLNWVHQYFHCGCGCDFKVTWMKEGGVQRMVNKIKTFFNLDCPYEFDITDITALIYTICAIGGMMGANMTVLWCIGATIATAFCWQVHRINLVFLNVALWVMNMWNLFQMIIGG